MMVLKWVAVQTFIKLFPMHVYFLVTGVGGMPLETYAKLSTFHEEKGNYFFSPFEP